MVTDFCIVSTLCWNSCCFMFSSLLFINDMSNALKAHAGAFQAFHTFFFWFSLNTKLFHLLLTTSHCCHGYWAMISLNVIHCHWIIRRCRKIDKNFTFLALETAKTTHEMRNKFQSFFLEFWWGFCTVQRAISIFRRAYEKRQDLMRFVVVLVEFTITILKTHQESQNRFTNLWWKFFGQKVILNC